MARRSTRSSSVTLEEEEELAHVREGRGTVGTLLTAEGSPYGHLASHLTGGGGIAGGGGMAGLGVAAGAQAAAQLGTALISSVTQGTLANEQMSMAARMNSIKGSQRVLEDLYQARIRGIQPFSNFSLLRLGQQQGFDQASAQLWNVRENLRARKYEHDALQRLREKQQKFELGRYAMETKHLNKERYLNQADFARGISTRGDLDRIAILREEADRKARADQQDLQYQSIANSIYNKKLMDSEAIRRERLNNTVREKLLNSLWL